ncbi:MAG: hypothetical protein IJW99_10710 [Clostridia bacterium]|nr:hypothetical protein [Clostridia bacterium]
MMGRDILFALEHVREDYILRAAPTGKNARRVYMRWAVVAACLCLCVGTLLGVMLHHEPAPVGEGITIPQSEVNLKKPTDGMYDMQALFIYNGRVYRHVQNVDNPSLRGRYLATVTGLIDEWTKADGYVELAGVTPGEIYTVKGYDPDFMLCQTYSGGVSIYTCTEGLTVYTGKDWFGDIYRLRRELDTVVCESAVCRNLGYRKPVEMGEEHQGLLRRLVDVLYDNPLMHTADVPREKKYSDSFNENRLYVMEMTLENGITLTMQLWCGGYLTNGAVAIKLDEELYEELLTVLGETCGAPWYLESGDILACTGKDIFADFYDLPGNIREAGVQSKMSWYGEYRAPAPLGEEGIELIYRLIDELRDTPAVHQNVMLAHQGWEREDDGMWYWVHLSDERIMILHEGGWVEMAGSYPLTFQAKSEAFDALWVLCERMTDE